MDSSAASIDGSNPCWSHNGAVLGCVFFDVFEKRGFSCAGLTGKEYGLVAVVDKGSSRGEAVVTI